MSVPSKENYEWDSSGWTCLGHTDNITFDNNTTKKTSSYAIMSHCIKNEVFH